MLIRSCCRAIRAVDVRRAHVGVIVIGRILCEESHFHTLEIGPNEIGSSIIHTQALALDYVPLPSQLRSVRQVRYFGLEVPKLEDSRVRVEKDGLGCTKTIMLTIHPALLLYAHF